MYVCVRVADMGAQRLYLDHSCFPVVLVLDDSRTRAANLFPLVCEQLFILRLFWPVPVSAWCLSTSLFTNRLLSDVYGGWCCVNEFGVFLFFLMDQTQCVEVRPPSPFIFILTVVN